MAGRPPKPTKLKLIEGNPGKRRLPKNEPRPELGIPTRPAWLSPEAKREWSRVARQLAEMGLLVRIDRALLSAYCECWATYVAAVNAIRENGMTFMTAKGYIGQRPEVGIATRMIEKMNQLSAKFGFTPSDRSKMAAPDVPDEDPFAAFLKSGQKANDG